MQSTELPNKDSAPHQRVRKPQKKISIPVSERLALTLLEFATLFGRQKVWAYRKMYNGELKVIEDLGVKMVPKSEVDRILGSANYFKGELGRRLSQGIKPGL